MKIEIVSEKMIEGMIFLVRGQKVIIDRDLAKLYCVHTKVLNQAVKRNHKRFPDDFILQLTKIEKNGLVTICDRFKTLKHSTVNPYAFTEHGVAMLSSVLNSEKAIQINIAIIRTFVKLRQLVDTNKEIAQKISQLERKYEHHDFQIQKLFDRVREIPLLARRKIYENKRFH